MFKYKKTRFFSLAKWHFLDFSTCNLFTVVADQKLMLFLSLQCGEDGRRETGGGIQLSGKDLQKLPQIHLFLLFKCNNILEVTVLALSPFVPNHIYKHTLVTSFFHVPIKFLSFHSLPISNGSSLIVQVVLVQEYFPTGANSCKGYKI